MMNKATAVDDRHQTMTWGAAQLGIGQGVLDAVADGLIEASGDLLVLVAVWVDPACDRRDGAPRGEPGRDAQGARRLRRRSRPGCGGRARRAARRAAQPVLLAASSMRIAAVETRAYRYPLDPPFRAGLGPGAARAPGGDDRGRPLRRRRRGLRERRRAARPRAPRAAPRRRRPVRTRAPCTGSSRRSTSTAGGNWIVEVAVWDLVGARRRRARCGNCSAGERSGCSPTRRAASWSTRTSAPPLPSRYATQACEAVKIRFHSQRLAPRRRGRRGRPRGGGDRARDHGRREPGLAHAGRPARRAGTSRRRSQFARALERLGVVLARGAASHRGRRGLRARCAANGRSRIAAGRDRARDGGGARPRPTRRRRRRPAGRRPRRRHRRRAGAIAALADVRGRALVPPHVVERHTACSRTCTRLSRSRPCPYLEVPFDPPGWSAERRDWLLPVTLEIAADGTVGAARRARARRRARLGRARAIAGRLMRIRAAVLHEPRQPLTGRGGRARPAARRARSSYASPRRASATRTCVSPTASWARGAGRSSSATRARAIVEAVGAGGRHTSRPATTWRSASCPPAASCRRRAPPGASTSARRGENGAARDAAWTGRARLRLADGTPLQHALMTACFAERRVVAAAGAVPHPARASAVAGIASRLRRRHRRSARSGTPPASERASPPSSSGAAASGCRSSRRRGIAGADPIVAVDRDAGEARARAHARARRTRSTSGSATTAARVVPARPAGGADHAFEVVGRPETIRLAWDALRPGGDGGRRRARAARRRRRAPGDRVPLRQGSSRLVLRIGRRGERSPAAGRARHPRRARPRRCRDGDRAARGGQRRARPTTGR